MQARVNDSVFFCPVGKVYKTPQEEARRKDVWLSNRRSVLAHNIRFYQKLEEHRMDMNKFSDLVCLYITSLGLQKIFELFYL